MEINNTEEFIKEANKIHNGKYLYGKTIFHNFYGYITVTCPKHGDFKIKAINHLRGGGCVKCHNENMSIERRMSNEEFIRRSKEINGNKYSYEKCNYTGIKKSVTLICPEHGEFKQIPENHLNGSGCPKCAKKESCKIFKIDFNEFLKRAKEKHGDKYMYDESSYTNMSSKTKIICQKHGEFWQIADMHINGNGCPKCVQEGLNKIGNDTFIKRSKRIHGDYYDYTKTNYTKPHKKITITCPEHGDFYLTMNEHISKGIGCPKCNRNIEITDEIVNKIKNEEFIEKANSKHNEKYTYEKCRYSDYYSNVIVTCPKHGDFEVSAGRHLSGTGCPKCVSESRGENRKMSYEYFVEKANKLYDGKYQYDKTTFTKGRDKMRMICPEHGEFWQAPSIHLRGHKCPKCGFNKVLETAKKHRKSTDDFIKQAKKVHGDKYIYDKTKYHTAYYPVLIKCPKHGYFQQAPYCHTSGGGCPKCTSSNMEKDVIKELDKLKIKYIHIARKKTLPWLDSLTLDFYIKENKVAIECQGEQHYIPVDFNGNGEAAAIEAFNDLIKRDNRKMELCKENGVSLEYIEFNDNTKEKLYEILRKHHCII